MVASVSACSHREPTPTTQAGLACAAVFAVAGLVGSLVGSSISKTVDGSRLLLLFAVAMAAIALSMARRPRSFGDPDVTITWRLAAKLAPLGLLTGLTAGFFGIGGGFLIVPGLMAAANMTLVNATASSLVSVALFGANGVLGVGVTANDCGALCARSTS